MPDAARDRLEPVLRALYSLVLYVLTPITVYHLIWRGFRQAAYFERWRERYAGFGPPREGRVLWVHAVSVGEVNAACGATASSTSTCRTTCRVRCRASCGISARTRR